MNCFEFLDWCNDNGYITSNHWNCQIDGIEAVNKWNTGIEKPIGQHKFVIC